MPSTSVSSSTMPTLSPSTPPSSASRSDGVVREIDVESHGSWPQIASRRSAASSTPAANGPI
jgi:hypothetical protein